LRADRRRGGARRRLCSPAPGAAHPPALTFCVALRARVPAPSVASYPHGAPPPAARSLPRHCHILEIPHLVCLSRAPRDSAFPMSCGAMRAARETLAARWSVAHVWVETPQAPFKRVMLAAAHDPAYPCPCTSLVAQALRTHPAFCIALRAQVLAPSVASHSHQAFRPPRPPLPRHCHTPEIPIWSASHAHHVTPHRILSQRHGAAQ